MIREARQFVSLAQKFKKPRSRRKSRKPARESRSRRKSRKPARKSRSRRESRRKRVRRSSKKKSKKMRSGVTRNLRLTNQTIRQAVRDYLAGGARKKDIVDKYGEISNWDVSNVTNMAGMFKNAISFNQPLNDWNVSNVLDMSQMFENAESFNQPLNKWNVSKVRDMNGMFMKASSFNQPFHAPWYSS